MIVKSTMYQVPSRKYGGNRIEIDSASLREIRMEIAAAAGMRDTCLR